jgi:hypothetical protein
MLDLIVNSIGNAETFLDHLCQPLPTAHYRQSFAEL